MKQMLRTSSSPSIWRHRDLRLMLPARALSTFGDDVALLVLMLRVYEHGIGPWSITGLLVCFAAPVALLGPLAARLVDSVPFRTLATVTAGWQAACCVGLAVASPVWSMYLLVVALQAGQVVANPVWQALVPSIAERDEIGRAVGASQSLNTIASVAAPAAAGILVGSLGYAAPLLVDAGTFLALGAAAVAVRTTRGGSVETTAEQDGSFSLRRDALLWPLIIGVCALVLAGEVTNVVEVFLLRGELGASTTTFGLVGGVLAAAIVVGSAVAAKARSDVVRARRTVAAALVLAIALALAGLAPTILIFAAAWAVVGVGNGMVNVDVGTLVLSRTPEACRGSVLARVNAMARGSSLGAMAIGGVAGTLVGPRATFVGAGTLMAAVAVVLLARFRRPELVESPVPSVSP
jgi:MFS family permease